MYTFTVFHIVLIMGQVGAVGEQVAMRFLLIGWMKNFNDLAPVGLGVS